MRKWGIPLLVALAVLTAAAMVTARLVRAERAGHTLDEVYLSALDEAREDLDEAEAAVEKLLISADGVQQAQLLSCLSRAGTGMTRCLAVLPVDHGTLRETMAFGNRLAEEAERLLTQVVMQGRMAETEQDRLEEELSACARLAGELALAQRSLRGGVQGLVLNDGEGAWPDREDDREAGTGPKALSSGPAVTQAEARKIAAGLLDGGAVPAGMTGGDMPSYLFEGQREGAAAMLAITGEGGRLLWMTVGSGGPDTGAGATDWIGAAGQFLAACGVDDLRLVWQEEHGNTVMLTWAAVQDGIVCYADLVRVKVRRDTGSIVGYDAAPYWRSHVLRDIGRPELNAAEAAALASPRLQVEEVQLCLLPREGQEVLCHELRARRGDRLYLVYLDANSGREVLLLRADGTERPVE